MAPLITYTFSNGDYELRSGSVPTEGETVSLRGRVWVVRKVEDLRCYLEEAIAPPESADAPA